MSESPYAKLARLHTELGEAYRDLDRAPAPQPIATQPATPRRAFKVRDLAERLGISERCVRDLRERGELPAPLPIPNVLRWDAQAIDNWIAERARG